MPENTNDKKKPTYCICGHGFSLHGISGCIECGCLAGRITSGIRGADM